MLIVEQAIYGEVKGGHGLRAASGDAAWAAELASRLDLPDTAPPGVDWSPFVSGFPFRDKYVIARTFRDPNASRAGMVLSHALIVPIDAIVATPDLRPIFGMLITQPEEPPSLSRLNVALSDLSPPALRELAATAAALVARGAKGTVVRTGLQDFEGLVVSLWGRLWPVLRRGFGFRISFGPGDLFEDPPPVLVCTPASLIARWQGYRQVDRFANVEASPASGMLSGDHIGEPLIAFASGIGAELSSFAELPLVEQAYRFAVLEPDVLANTLAAIRLTEHLSPQSSRGEVGKRRLLDHLILQLESATPDDLLLLRNLRLDGFSQAQRVWIAVARRLTDNTLEAKHDAAFLTIVADALATDKASEQWRQAVLAGTTGAARAGIDVFASALWRWAQIDPSLTEPLWARIGIDNALEALLVKAAPESLEVKPAQPILEYAAKNRLYRLHGVTVAAAYTPDEAARLQTILEPVTSDEGVKLALKRATPNQILACAIDVGEPRLVLLAANEVAKEPELLSRIDMGTEVSLAIWGTALEINLDAWRGPEDPRAAFDRVLVDLINDVPIHRGLVDQLAKTPLGDLTAFARRSELWSKLVDPARARLLGATARGWLNNAEAGQEVSVVEPALGEAILGSGELATLLDRLSNGRIAHAVQIVSILDRFDEARFRQWMRAAMDRTRFIPQGDAEVLGRLVSGRHWQGAVDDLLSWLTQGRNDVRPALRQCISFVGFFDRILHRLAPVTSSDKWDALWDLAAKLYPSGPDHDGLWERAGGQDADLLWGINSNGRSRWRTALTRIRYGGDPPVEDLLREMRNDYATNAELRYLAEDYEFRRD